MVALLFCLDCNIELGPRRVGRVQKRCANCQRNHKNKLDRGRYKTKDKEWKKERTERALKNPSCREKKNATSRRYYARNKEKHNKLVIDRYKERRATEPDYKAWADARVSAWKKNNPDSRKAWNAAYRARKKAAGPHFTAQEWANLKDHYAHRCLGCGRPETERPLTPDHVIPLVAGGSNNIDNIQPLCQPCNSSKKDQILDLR